MKRIGYAVAMLSALGSAPIAAQESPSALTLDAALRLARAGNPEFLRTANDLEVAGNAVRSAWGGFLPSLNTSLNFSGSRSTTLTGEDFFGDPIESPEPVTSTRSSASQGISTQVTLFDGGTTLRNLQARRAAYSGVDAQIEAQAIQLDARVSREYFQAARAVRNIALEEYLLASARDLSPPLASRPSRARRGPVSARRFESPPARERAFRASAPAR
jgi:outer membrane protein TolC